MRCPAFRLMRHPTSEPVCAWFERALGEPLGRDLDISILPKQLGRS